MSMASGSPPTTPSRGPISGHTRPANSTRSTTISGDPSNYGEVYVGFKGGGYAYLPAASSTAPTVTGVTASPATGTEVEGNSIMFTVNMSEVVTVAGGTPTLTLNDGGTAKYTGGSGTNALTFSYTVASTDSAVSTLAITAVNLPSGVTITDSSGNAANMAGAVDVVLGLVRRSPRHGRLLPGEPSRA